MAKALFPLPNVWTMGLAVASAYMIAKATVFAIIIFPLIAWQRRHELWAEMRVSDNERIPGTTLGANIVSFALLLFARRELSEAGETTTAVWQFTYSILVLTTALSLLLFIFPQRFIASLTGSWRRESAIALGGGFFGISVAELFNQSALNVLSESDWDALSSVTLHFSYWLLALFQNDAFVDSQTRVLGAGNFSVEIFVGCSGYEGMALIAIFLTGYLWIFRRSLRFPQVLVLFPLAMGIIWLFNAVRIALLVAIGANISPEVALGGFHSQFGWISFLLVAITIMTVAQQIPFFSTVSSRRGSGAPVPSRSADDEILYFLAPFIAMMAAQIAIRAFAPHDQPLYPLKDLAIAGAIYLYRRGYTQFAEVPSIFSIVLGALAGILWVVTDPGVGSETALSRWIAELTPLAFVAWLCFRGIGTIIMVPIAEELAFRGYLYRVVIARPFESVDLKAFSMRALIVSSVLFGMMHDRWMAAALAGALYALLMCWRGRLSDAITAHMTTNAVIFAWAVATGQWSLL
ncbi:exosortase E/protease, VPEID-CTERM system [Hyphomicrobium sp.]|jgi:exosortase E/protease (VPEID-CTERM system)|uniref:exosortase E/protease, VPEID-CTERM system n=1 Tax=Hyphomicrobium sp. TaxID=82 RepID=UPI002C70C83F|nr:exosortase E/protease, VPEID-CTERM system [Hyphomicrobium sp.]HVZ05408.1 exosortase E/protease, VPEID-CTERM system [Hyphomicrobium sp.]